MTRKIDFFDGAQSGTTPTLGNVTADNLVTYANDAAYEAAVSGAPVVGNIYYNTTDDKIRYYNGTVWTEVLGAQLDATTIADGSVNNTEFQYINSLTSNAQDQIDTAQGTADANTTDIADVRTTTGTADGETNMGTYTGSTINDNESTKQNLQQLETAIENLVSGLAFQGNWDASTNTPTLVSSTGTAGHYYVVSVDGSTNLDGVTDWVTGDWAVFTDTGVWQKIDNTSSVTSVAGKTGVVTLDAGDITDFDTEVSNNTSVTANTAKVSADGGVSTHSDVDTTGATEGQVLTWDNGDSEWQPGDLPSQISVATVAYELTSGTAGGTASSGSWNSRPLNTLVDPSSFVVSLSANQITLPAGDYVITGSASFYRTAFSQLRLQNATDVSNIENGNSGEVISTSGTVAEWVELHAVFTLASQKAVEIEYRVSSSFTTHGLGRACSFTGETHAKFKIFKVG